MQIKRYEAKTFRGPGKIKRELGRMPSFYQTSSCPRKNARIEVVAAKDDGETPFPFVSGRRDGNGDGSLPVPVFRRWGIKTNGMA